MTLSLTRRLGTLAALALLCMAVAAPSASAHRLPKFLARENTYTLMKRICHEDPRPCRGWAVQRCARRSDHRVDCRASHSFRENGVDKTCRMWAATRLRGNVYTTRILRATVNCGPA
jgi:hypothetical protein